MKSTTIPANLISWIDYNLDTDFPIQNIPFGIGKPMGRSPRVVTIVGRKIVDILAMDSDELDMIGKHAKQTAMQYFHHILLYQDRDMGWIL